MTNWCSTNCDLHLQHKCENNVYSKHSWPSHILSVFARIYHYLFQVNAEKLQHGPRSSQDSHCKSLTPRSYWTPQQKKTASSILDLHMFFHLTPKNTGKHLLPRIEILNTNTNHQLQPAAPEAPKQMFIAPGHHWIAHTSRKCQS